MGEIPLFNKEGLMSIASSIDDEDYDLAYSLNPWHLRHGYAVHTSWLSGQNRSTDIKLHRLVMSVTDPEIHVDHVDRNPLNNTKQNLRLVTHAQNMQNLGVKAGKKTSRYRGVAYNPLNNNWRVQCMLNQKHHNVGSFKTEEEANQAAIQWRRENMPFSVEVN